MKAAGVVRIANNLSRNGDSLWLKFPRSPFLASDRRSSELLIGALLTKLAVCVTALLQGAPWRMTTWL